MATASLPEALNGKTLRRRVDALRTFVESHPVVRELLIVLGFTFLTSAMTWPWVTRLRDAVADPGDPYMISWVLWWDFHQTFRDPVHLFNANVFFPLTNTLAFSENAYGIALLFFPLFALGFHPLTVNSVATFLGFAFCGYGAFRLTRTLSGSISAAWIAGIIFAFLPYRFHLLSHLHYLFSGWVPLHLEALVLFSRQRSWKRAAWFAVAFAMNALSCLTWFMLSLTPLVFTTGFLVIRYQLYRDRNFWLRGAVVMSAASVVLLPFLLPYYYVNKAYGFRWNEFVVQNNSPTTLHWLVAEYRNRLWKGFGDGVQGGNYRLFPGLLPLLLGAAALIIPSSPSNKRFEPSEASEKRSAWVLRLDLVAVMAVAVALVAAGWSGVEGLAKSLLNLRTVDHAILVSFLAVGIRLMISYPLIVQRAVGNSNLLQTIRATKHEGLWIALIWTFVGFLMSLGTNSLLFRLLFEHIFLFRAMREPSRAAMIASLGLAVLAGIGTLKVANALRRRKSISEVAVVLVVALALLFELRAAPLRFTRGAVYPDALALRLKDTPMRGGLVELPSGGDEVPHLYMLRSADHAKPLINGISTFVPAHSYEITHLARQSPIPLRLLDLLEQVPTSYLTIHNGFLDPAQRGVYEAFLMQGVITGRLRFINRFDGLNDLYAVVKNEPEAKSEAPLPFETFDSWSQALDKDPENLVSQYRGWSQELYRVMVVADGRPPRYEAFLKTATEIGKGLLPGWEDQFRRNLREYVERKVDRPEFKQRFAGLDDRQFVEQLLSNAELKEALPEADSMAGDLSSGKETKASLLLKIASDPRLQKIHQSRSVVLLHFFAYLRRNPDDPPDNSMDGFRYWVSEVEKHGGAGEDLARSFMSSIEYMRNHPGK